MRAETRIHRNRVSDPGPNWIRSGEDILKTDPLERVVVVDPLPVRPVEAAARPTIPPEVPASRSPVPTGRGGRAASDAGWAGHAKVGPTLAFSGPNRGVLPPMGGALPPMVAPDSLPPIFEEEAPSCRANPVVDPSYAGGAQGIRRGWAEPPMRRRHVPTAELMAAPLAPPDPEPTPSLDDDDEQSTGVFEPGEDPYSRYFAARTPSDAEIVGTEYAGPEHAGPEYAGQEYSGAESSGAELSEDHGPSEAETLVPHGQQRPSLTLVRSVSESVEEEYVGMRAAPLPTEPRPMADEVVDWPPPMVRPGIDYPDDWSAADMGNTLIVIDPIARRARQSRVVVWVLDGLAWVLGFVAMFFTGLVTTGSAALVFFALSL